ncbi:MAG TPA: cation:proton antiporter [Patescibacteria group bacterium]|nr:cation:proton antiporter [Patescibacteria group bacterium]
MDPHSISLIETLLLVFISAIAGGLIAKRLKQPTLIGFIASGVLFGNLFASWVNQSFLQTIADTGVTLLLFTIGVEFSFHKLRKVMKTASWAAITQILLSILVFIFILLFLGFSFYPALYIAVAGALSSTAIIVKVLSERGELESVPGELATGWSVIQDLSVIPIMILLPALVHVGAGAGVSAGQLFTAIGGSFIKSAIALCVIFYLGRKGIPRALNLAATAGNREIFLLSTIGIVFLSALVTYSVGLSAALGAFIAGLLISETSQNHAIFAEVRPLRDLFGVVFFVSLGMILPIHEIISMLPLLLLVTACVLGIKWFLVFGLSRYLGNHRKTAFYVAVALMQMSEFGFIIARDGLSSGVLTQDRYVFLVTLTFFTMVGGTVFLSHVHSVYYSFYKTLGKLLPKVFSTKQELSPNREELSISGHIVICGYGRVGKYIGRALEMARIPYLVVDYNQATIASLRTHGVSVVYGDPADKDVLDYAQIDKARAVIIAIPDRHTQEMVISNAQTLNRHIRIICRTHHEEDQSRLKSLGVHMLVQPEFEAALSVVEKLLPEFGVTPDDLAGKISRLKIEHGLG